MILLVGSEGSMGKRYKAILEYLGQDYICKDVDQWVSDEAWSKITASIIAAPTESHTKYIRWCGELGPVLCEKPITKSMNELEQTLHMCRQEGIKLTMMMQYQVFDSPLNEGHSYYNYYNTGKDGLNWDCIQILGLARSSVTIANNSPIWECQINGQKIDRAKMDWAYLEFTKNWLNGKIKQDHGWLMDAHYKAAEWNEC